MRVLRRPADRHLRVRIQAKQRHGQAIPGQRREDHHRPPMGVCAVKPRRQRGDHRARTACDSAGCRLPCGTQQCQHRINRRATFISMTLAARSPYGGAVQYQPKAKMRADGGKEQPILDPK